MKYREVAQEEADLWDKLADHPMQSWAWGEFRKKRQKITRLGVYENQTLARGYLVTWTRLYNWSVGYIPMGPVPNDEDIAELVQVGVKHNAIFIRMEPNSTNTDTIPLPKGRHLFKPKTYWWNLQKTEEQLLMNMHQKGRYNIKVAMKHGVQIVEDNSAISLEHHISLLMETAKRQGVKFHTADYHRQLWQSLKPRIFLAKYNDQILASAMVFVHKKRAYYAYGGNSLAHREVMASTLLLWEVAKTLKKEHFEILDLWGTEEGKGFSQFKEKFGADLISFVGTYDLPVSRMLYVVARIGEEVRWKLRQIWH